MDWLQAGLGDYHDDGTYLGQEEDRAPTVALKSGDHQLRLRWSSAWTDEPHTAETFEVALVNTDALLTRAFRSGRLNFASPVALGRHLLAQAWKLDGIKVPPAPPDVRELLATIGPQGRHECLTLPGRETIPALYGYDMTLAYLWCCKGLPYGQVSSVKEGGHKRRCQWVAPDGWAHIGLLPERQQGWRYPLQGSGWLDEREVALAERNGWEVRPEVGWQWESEGALDRWSDGLQACLREARRAGDRLVYRMLRRAALNTIGSLHRSTVKRDKACPVAMDHLVPAGNSSVRWEGGLYYWQEEVPLSGSMLLYCHPEWTTTIWARCRARVTQAALQFAREQVVAIRQDCLFVTDPHPTWKAEDDAVGRFRIKEQLPGPLPAPHSLEDLQRLRAADAD